MKNLFLIFFVLIVASSFGQVTVKEPPFLQIKLVDKGDGVLLKNIKPRAYVSGRVTKVKFKGLTSETLIKKDEIIHFIYCHTNSAGAAKKELTLVKLDIVKEKNRYIIYNSWSKKGSEIMKYSVKPYGEKSYLVTIENFEVGEYAFVQRDLAPHIVIPNDNFVHRVYYPFSVAE